MHSSLRAVAGLLLTAATLPSVAAKAQNSGRPSIRRVQVLRNSGQLEVEIEASDRVVPRANVLTGPDRLVVDFVNAVPSAELHNQAVNRGEVKDLRVGLFSANPPVTRIVLDLNGPQPYQVFPSGRTVVVKIGAGAGLQSSVYHPAGARLVTTDYSSHPPQITPPVRIAPAPLQIAPVPPESKPLEVSFENGQLSVISNKANLSEVLFAIHQRTGAQIAIPAGAEQEQVVAAVGPAPAPEVLASLLNGSKFNFLILSSPTDPAVLDRVILSSKPEGPMPPPRMQAREYENDDTPEPEPAKPSASAKPVVKTSTDAPEPAPDNSNVGGRADPLADPPANARKTGDTDVPD